MKARKILTGALLAAAIGVTGAAIPAAANAAELSGEVGATGTSGYVTSNNGAMIYSKPGFHIGTSFPKGTHLNLQCFVNEGGVSYFSVVGGGTYVKTIDVRAHDPKVLPRC